VAGTQVLQVDERAQRLLYCHPGIHMGELAVPAAGPLGNATSIVL
jgi:hypothetical protein